MPYRNLECNNEKTYRWHFVNDIKQHNDPILQSIIKQVKKDTSSVFIQSEGITTETITELMEKYNPRILGIQTIHCQACKHLQVDVIIDNQTKIREDLWRSYEADRFVNQFMRGNNG